MDNTDDLKTMTLDVFRRKYGWDGVLFRLLVERYIHNSRNERNKTEADVILHMLDELAAALNNN